MTAAVPDAGGPWNGVDVLVTGALGFLGQPLVRALVAEGAHVHGVARRPPATSLGATWSVLDVTDGAALRAALEQVKPQVVFHLTTAGSGARDLALVRQTVRDDLVASVEMLSAAVDGGVGRLVITGSMEEPDVTKGEVPSSPYAAAKWAATGYARMFAALYGLEVVILKPFMTYGPGQRPEKLLPYVIRTLLDGRTPELGSGTRPVDWVYLDDMIDAFMRAGTAPAVSGETIELGSGTLTPVREVVELVSQLMGATLEPRFGAIEDRSLEVVRAAETDRATALLGWRASTALDAGLRRTIEWHRAPSERA